MGAAASFSTRASEAGGALTWFTRNSSELTTVAVFANGATLGSGCKKCHPAKVSTNAAPAATAHVARRLRSDQGDGSRTVSAAEVSFSTRFMCASNEAAKPAGREGSAKCKNQKFRSPRHSSGQASPHTKQANRRVSACDKSPSKKRSRSARASECVSCSFMV